MIGNQKVAVSVDHALGSLSILQINADGSLFVEVQEIALNKSLQVDQKVYLYDATGDLKGVHTFLLPASMFRYRIVSPLAQIMRSIPL